MALLAGRLLIVLARVIISWIPVNRYHPLVRFINDVTEPLLRPFRAVLPVGRGGIDFSPLILFIVLGIVQRIVVGLLARGLP